MISLNVTWKLRRLAILISSVVSLIFLSAFFALQYSGTSTSFQIHGGKKLSLAKSLYSEAGNSTLGFEKIVYINLDYRHDLDDAIALQSAVSGIDVEKITAVSPDSLEDKGLAPSSLGGSMKPEITACFRSHANAWQHMLLAKWETMIVMEGDATWDKNIRQSMPYYAQALDEFFIKVAPGLGKSPKSHVTNSDPYNRLQWDIIQLGQCFEDERDNGTFIKFKDPNAPERTEYYHRPLFGERVIRKAFRPICTTGYAVSRQGAMKLLLRAAIDFNAPVDLVIAQMVEKGELVGVSTVPPLIAQWDYTSDIGANHLNSDINQLPKKVTTEESKKKWEQVRKDRNIWRLNGFYSESNFRQWALSSLNSTLYPLKNEQN